MHQDVESGLVTEIQQVDHSTTKMLHLRLVVEDHQGREVELEAEGGEAEALLSCSLEQVLRDPCVERDVRGRLVTLVGKLVELGVRKAEERYRVVHSSIV